MLLPPAREALRDARTRIISGVTMRRYRVFLPVVTVFCGALAPLGGKAEIIPPPSDPAPAVACRFVSQVTRRGSGAAGMVLVARADPGREARGRGRDQ